MGANIGDAEIGLTGIPIPNNILALQKELFQKLPGRFGEPAALPNGAAEAGQIRIFDVILPPGAIIFPGTYDARNTLGEIQGANGIGTWIHKLQERFVSMSLKQAKSNIRRFC